MRTKFIIYFLAFVHLALVTPGYSDTRTKREMLADLVQHIPQSLPCHEIKGLRYFSGFPASIVGADDETGKMTSNQYKQSLFKPIHLQKFDDRQKHYILPAFYGDFSDPDNLIGYEGKGEFAGFVAYAVTKIVEPYQRLAKDEKGNDIPGERGKHYFGFITQPEQDRIPGGRHVEGIVVPEKKNYIDGDKPPVIIPPMAHYEICHSPTYYEAQGDYSDLYRNHLKIYGELGQVAQLFFDLASGGNPYDTLGNPKYSYTEKEIPTLLGYWIHYGHQMNQTEKNLEDIKEGLILLTSPLPLGGSIVAITDAFISNEAMDPLAWGSLALTAASDSLVIFKVPKAAAVLSKVLPKGVKPDTAVNFVMKNTGKANMALGGIYAYQGDYAKAFGSVLSGASDLVSVKIENGELSFGRLKPIQNPVCSTEFKKTSNVKTMEICSNTKRFITNKLGKFINLFTSRLLKNFRPPIICQRLFQYEVGDEMADFVASQARLIETEPHKVIATLANKSRLPTPLSGAQEATEWGSETPDYNLLKFTLNNSREHRLNLDRLTGSSSEITNEIRTQVRGFDAAFSTRRVRGKTTLDYTNMTIRLSKLKITYKGSDYLIDDLIKTFPNLMQTPAIKSLFNHLAKVHVEEYWHCVQNFLRRKNGSQMPMVHADEVISFVSEIFKRSDRPSDFPGDTLIPALESYRQKFSDLGSQYNPDAGDCSSIRSLFGSSAEEWDFAAFTQEIGGSAALDKYEQAFYSARPLVLRYAALRRGGKPAGLETLEEAAKTALSGW